MRLKFTGRIENGDLFLDDQYLYDKHKLSLNGKKVQATLEKYKTQRSIRQNKFYWGVVIPIIGEWTGELDHDDIHFGLKDRFLNKRNIKGLNMPSTKKLTTTEFEIYLERIKMWLAEEGIVVPEPNQLEDN